MGVPGGRPPADAETLLAGVESELGGIADLTTTEQVPVFDRMHSVLADALARTADTGGQPGPGSPGA
jgi:hypothetical protein